MLLLYLLLSRLVDLILNCAFSILILRGNRLFELDLLGVNTSFVMLLAATVFWVFTLCLLLELIDFDDLVLIVLFRLTWLLFLDQFDRFVADQFISLGLGWTSQLLLHDSWLISYCQRSWYFPD